MSAPMQNDASPSVFVPRRAQPLAHVPLRWLVFGITMAAIVAFATLAAVDRRAAPIALAAALLVAVKGLGWLLVLRHYRARLRRHGYRW